MERRAAALTSTDALVDAIDAALPQTQCTRCGYPDCRGYAEAIVTADAPIDRCPPGGADGIARLAGLTGRPPVPLDTDRGREGPRLLASIDEAACIGCTLCIQACPVDCIVGAAKRMHTVVASQCTGCELCVPACPVDCISLAPVTGELTGWQAWTPEQADTARRRYRARRAREARKHAADAARLAAASPQRQAGGRPPAVEAALARARSARRQ